MRKTAIASIFALLVPTLSGCSKGTETTGSSPNPMDPKDCPMNKPAVQTAPQTPLITDAGGPAPTPPSNLPGLRVPVEPQVADVHSLGNASMVGGGNVSGQVRNDGKVVAKGVTVSISAFDRSGKTGFSTAKVEPADLAPGELGTFNVKLEGLGDAFVSVDAVQWATKADDLARIKNYNRECDQILQIAVTLRDSSEGQLLKHYKMNGIPEPRIVAKNDADAPRTPVAEPVRTASAPIAAPRQDYSRGEEKHHHGDKHNHQPGSFTAEGSAYIGPTSGIPIYDNASGRGHVIKYLDRATYSIVRFAGNWNWVMYRDPRNPKDPNVYYGWVRA